MRFQETRIDGRTERRYLVAGRRLALGALELKGHAFHRDGHPRGHIVLRGSSRYGHLQLDEACAGRERRDAAAVLSRDDASTALTACGSGEDAIDAAVVERRRLAGRGRAPDGKKMDDALIEDLMPPPSWKAEGHVASPKHEWFWVVAKL